MTNVVFARPREEFGSYTDLWQMITLSRFPLRYIDEIDWTVDQTVIATPKHPEWSCIPDRHAARLIWWSIERMANVDLPMDMANPYVPPCVDEVWVSDRSLATNMGAKYVFLGGHRSFGSVNGLDKQYDIITLMAPWARRTQVLKGLRQFKVADTGDLWGDERDRRLRQSRLMVMCHQDEQPICEPPRMMIGGSYALPMVCELSEDSGYWIQGVHYCGVTLEQLPAMVLLFLVNPVRAARLGLAAWQLVCVEHPFRQEVEAAL